MTSSVFDSAFALVIGVEGGYVNDPNDHGGETKYGISKRSYPAINIPSLTLDTAKAIYRRDYWDKVQAGVLPAPVSVVLFDYAVNSGPGGKIELLQIAVGAEADGVIGPQTTAAVNRMGGAKAAAELTARRMVALAKLPAWSLYGLGWSRRMAGILAAAIAMDAPLSVTTTISPLPDIERLKQAMREVLAERSAAA